MKTPTQVMTDTMPQVGIDSPHTGAVEGGRLVISLDFELLWGVRDHADRTTYGVNILGARDAVPRILDIFADNGIRATWATVGFLFCESRDELLDSVPSVKPDYRIQPLSSYRYLDEVGTDEATDPYYFAPSLIDLICSTPGQEVGTHTLSHYYCLEDGQTLDAFEADLRAARKLARRRGIELKSIVFPRNQFAPEHIAVCARTGIKVYRGNPGSWAYRPTKGAGQTPTRRALRLLDAYSGVLGSHAFRATVARPTNVPASRFLRPCAGRLAPFHALHLAAVERGMTAAARAGECFHLWWHPHNFGVGLGDNLAGLERLVAHFRRLQDDHGMASMAMGDFA